MAKRPNIDPARKVAADCVSAVVHRRQLLDMVFDGACDDARLAPTQRGFAFNLTMATIRNWGAWQRVLGDLLDKRIAPKARYGEAVLATALTQIFTLNTAEHAAVDQAVGLTRATNATQHLGGLVNAVLRRALREHGRIRADLDANPIWALPAWIAGRWTAAHGQDTTAALAAVLSTQPPVDIQLKPGISDAPYTALGGVPVAEGCIRFKDTDIPSLPGFEDGDFWVQDLAASWPVRLLGDVSGQHVLDLCAAPGGKTMQLAAMGAEVTALDRSAKRMQMLEANLARTGLKADIVVEDALAYQPKPAFDAVLVDAPCSATGTFRRHPDVLWTKSETDIAKLAALQTRMLDHAQTLVRPGGVIVYCTCSLEAEEGEDQIDAFLARTPSAKRLPVAPVDLPEAGAQTTGGDMRLRPDMRADIGGLDGFFAARIRMSQ